jgi:hypothetical protein
VQSRKKIYHPKRIRKKTHRAYVKRRQRRPMTKAEIRRRVEALLDRILREMERFHRSPAAATRREHLKKIEALAEEALELRPRSAFLRNLRRECRALGLSEDPETVRRADLGDFMERLRSR